MATYARVLLLAAFLLVGSRAVFAQQPDPRPVADDYQAERTLVETALRTVIDVIQEVTLRHAGPHLGPRLHQMTDRLQTAASPLAFTDLPGDPTLTPDDLDELADLLREVHQQMVTLRVSLEDDGDVDLADRLAAVEGGLADAVNLVERLRRTDADTAVTYADGERWLRPGRYDAGRRMDRGDDHDEDWERDWERDWDDEDWSGRRDRDRDPERDWRDRRDRRDRFGWRGYAGAFVGEYPFHWPYRERALYRPIPSIRYNRVEGLVLGVGRRPMNWDSYERFRIFGQVGYAFALDDWRYEAGAEARLGPRYGNEDFDFKVGGAYRKNTATNDLWKSGWTENSVAAFFFKEDFFDYFETEGWTVYGLARVSPFAQIGLGYREDDYRSLANETGWSLFGGDQFRTNPSIAEGRMQSVVLSVEGGRIRDLNHDPRGAAFRFEAEFGDGVGGDFAFNRYLGDVRAYLPTGGAGHLALRLRAGRANGDNLPIQKAFTLGGIGSVRAYPQNLFIGSRMLLANAELTFFDADLFDEIFEDIQLFGLFDAGWVNNRGTNDFSFDDVIPAAGFGLGLDDRHLRLELAWPLRDLGTGLQPTLWLRLNPTF